MRSLKLLALAATTLVACGYDWTVGPAPAGSDGGPSGTDSGTQTTFPPSGLPACAATSNTNSCDCASGTCQGSFPAGAVTIYCRSGATCDTQCAGGNCNIYCESGANCTTNCAGGSCTIDCLSGSTCNGSCPGGTCTFICLTGATCNNSCTSGGCTTKTTQ